MGCAQSKIENEETVTRCKERKHHMKEAVSARNAFAAAHSSYTMSLKNTGAALSDYAHGEIQFTSFSTSTTTSAPIPPISQPSYDNLPPPPPPLPNFAPPPLQRAVTMPEFSIPKPDLTRSEPIIEEEEEEEYAEDHSHSLKHRSTRSAGSSKTGISTNTEIENEGDLPIPPPSPPRTPPLRNHDPPPPPPPRPETNGMSWDFFFPDIENVPGPSLAEVDESRIEREEIERKAFEERSKRVAAERKAEEAEEVEKAAELPPQPPPAVTTKVVKKVRHGAAPGEGKRAAKGGGASVNLLQIFSELDDCFLKASESAQEVSKMLEANRLHYHSNFADNRGNETVERPKLSNICGSISIFLWCIS